MQTTRQEEGARVSSATGNGRIYWLSLAVNIVKLNMVYEFDSPNRTTYFSFLEEAPPITFSAPPEEFAAL